MYVLTCKMKSGSIVLKHNGGYAMLIRKSLLVVGQVLVAGMLYAGEYCGTDAPSELTIRGILAVDAVDIPFDVSVSGSEIRIISKENPAVSYLVCPGIKFENSSEIYTTWRAWKISESSISRVGEGESPWISLGNPGELLIQDVKVTVHRTIEAHYPDLRGSNVVITGPRVVHVPTCTDAHKWSVCVTP